MLVYERDFIYKTVPNLTEAINNLASKLEQQNDDPFKKAVKSLSNKSDSLSLKENTDSLYLFYKELDEANITIEDFTGNIECILGLDVSKDSEEDKAMIKEAWSFIEKIYKIALKCL